MLTRVLEPEVMDTAEDALDYDLMDHSAVNALFAADFLRLWSGDNPVLDVGTGTALIPIEICRLDPRPAFVAVDLSAEMLKRADRHIADAGLTGRITTRLTDAKRLPFADGEFAAVVSNSIVHHIPEPAACVAEMARVCRAGGLLLVRDLLRPADETSLTRLVAMHAAGATDRQRQLFSESLRAALSLGEIRGIVAALGFAPDTVQVTSDRHWTWVARR